MSTLRSKPKLAECRSQSGRPKGIVCTAWTSWFCKFVMRAPSGPNDSRLPPYSYLSRTIGRISLRLDRLAGRRHD